MADSGIFSHSAEMIGKAVDISAKMLLQKITILNYSISEGGR
jgi:hypothetical protein